MKQAKIIAVCAMVVALSFVMMLFGSVTQIMDLTMAAICSLLMTYVVIEIGGCWPWLVWLATSTLSLLLLPDKFVACVYLGFAGYYPMLKQIFEKHIPFIPCWIVKIVYFNIVLTGILLVSKFVLMMSDDEISFGYLAYILCNPAFILFDFALTRLITVYLLKFRKRLGLKIKK